ncbi:uncharacterized protein M6B38_368450 [Iris pallida]|uniref:Receptor-like serine/threonine-protein kinase n=1 Tax=Iris pallida TaxID=29817 RepID=A0AAX6GGD9_IRIPA|nr:uncharacterized protein M6B38_368450 [Iris pallida]
MTPLLLLFLLLSSANLSYALDSISASQPLSGEQKLTSEGGNFALGFFKPGKPNYYYIGIWYNKISKQTPVWVASRDTPITDPATTQLKISADGNLVLSNHSTPTIWSTRVANISSAKTLAVLLDSGNLVLRDASRPNVTLWQSIDHPTHTWLPGGKLGLNKVTGVSQHLTSWKSSEDPSSGIYHLELDANGTSQYYIIWNNSYNYNYWTSGTWNGHIFSLVPEMTANYIYDFQYVSTPTENYFTYSVKSSIMISRFIMDVSGHIQQQTWLPESQEWILFWSQPKDQCGAYSLCGPYGICNQNVQPYCKCVKGFSETSPTNWDLLDRTGGCTRDTQLQCSRNSSDGGAEKDKFYPMLDTGLPDNSKNLRVGSSSDCEQACLNNCSCTAYSYDTTTGCYVWYGELRNLQEQVSSGGGTLFLRLAASEIQSPPKSKKKENVVVAAIGGAAGCLIFLAIVWVLIWRRRRGMAGKSKAVEGGLLAFRYSDLQRATKNFSEKLGGGAFGSVFKGTLPNSTAIAVKKLEGLRQGEKQFRTEVSTIGTVQHVNLVRLHGFCSEGSQKLLVYEYMPKGSLDTHLFHDMSAAAVPDWKTRYQIALGTARGLTYLHEQCRDCIIHCDIKPENILLDSSFVPKVADFGLAKLMGRDFSRVLTTMRGTRGYLAPEWISGVAITAKADVYSYGMMLFEIISGKRNSDQGEELKIGFFPTLAATKLMEGDAVSLLDKRLNGDGDAEEVTRACKVACWCIQDNEDARPSMGQVVQILEGVVEVNMPPMPRALQVLADTPGNIVFYSELTSNSSQAQSATSASSQTKSTSSVSSKD